jgi:hypothetical protein
MDYVPLPSRRCTGKMTIPMIDTTTGPETATGESDELCAQLFMLAKSPSKGLSMK